MAPEEAPAIQDSYDEASSWCYGCGRLNEQGLHIRTFVEDGEPVTRFTPDARYTGARDFVYGGLIASLIDCHSTAAAAAAGYEAQGRPVGSEPRLRYVTASLKVDFLAPTPVGVALTVREGPGPSPNARR